MQPPSLRRTLTLAWPLILGNISIPLLNVVDTAIAGRIPGPEDLASVALGASWITLVFWAFSFLRQATGGLTANAVGQKSLSLIAGYLQKGALVALVAGTLVVVMGQWAVGPVIVAADVSPALQPILLDYLSIRLFGAPAVLFLYVVYGWWIGQGHTRLAVALLMGMNLLNMVLSAWLGLALEWGAVGIAYGTLAAEWVCALGVGIWILLKAPTVRRRWQLTGITALLKANGWVMLRTLSLLAVFTWFNTQSAQLSPEVAAVNAVLLTLLSVAAYALDGFSDAAEIQMGHAHGAGQTQWLRAALKYTALCSVISAAIATALLVWLAEPLVAVLVPQPNLIDQVTPWLVYLIPLPLVAWLSYWLDGVYIGLNRFKAMAGVMLLSTALVYFPLNFAWAAQELQGQWESFWAWQVARALGMALVFAIWVYPRTLASHPRPE